MADEKTTTPEQPDDPDQLDEIYNSVMTCEPSLTHEQVSEIEKLFASKGFAQVRRASLAVATGGGDFYRKVAEDRETAVLAAGIMEAARDHIQRLRGLADVLEQMATRADVALCAWPDKDQIVIEGDAFVRE